jgi:hypothetical protein
MEYGQSAGRQGFYQIGGDKMELPLVEGDLVEWLVEPELRADRRMDLGDVLEIENIAVKCRGWIGDAPFSLDAEQTARMLDAGTDSWRRAARPEFVDRFVLTTFGVQTLGGIINPEGLGLELVFRDNERGLNQGQRIHIHTLFPAARFQVTGTRQTSAGAEMETTGQFQAVAELKPPGQLMAIASGLTDMKATGVLKGSINQKVWANDKREITWSTTTYAAMVEAIGEGDTRALWVFHKPQGPLVGKTFETVTGLTLSRKKTEIKFDARMFVIFKIGPYPIRRYSHWVRLTTDWSNHSMQASG